MLHTLTACTCFCMVVKMCVKKPNVKNGLNILKLFLYGYLKDKHKVVTDSKKWWLYKITKYKMLMILILIFKICEKLKTKNENQLT